MTYNYSICHPDNENIEYPKKVLIEDEVLEMVKNYPWLDILKSMEKIPDEKIHFSPSLDFVHSKNKISLGISATLENNNPEFSLWYNRPVKSRRLFGLLSDKVKMKVIDKWGFNLDEAIKIYHIFLSEKYSTLERVMKN